MLCVWNRIFHLSVTNFASSRKSHVINVRILLAYSRSRLLPSYRRCVSSLHITVLLYETVN